MEMNDNRLDVMISNVLRTGVLLALAIVVTGGVLYLMQHGPERETFSSFAGERSDLRTFGGIIRSGMQLKSEALIQIGLLVLIATPIVRVALAAAGFAFERDGLYVVVSLIVLSILMASIFTASGG
jgi:uncharacterized membrane protein